MRMQLYFNTSNVIFYPAPFLLIRGLSLISIHPMLFFILNGISYFLENSDISIHPMLFFILSVTFWAKTGKDFNTSNVIFYRLFRDRATFSYFISIHPMLFFIHFPSKFQIWGPPFQYIQCYFLSCVRAGEYEVLCLFQYIQCYFLSVDV